jgi:hypothetical protein
MRMDETLLGHDTSKQTLEEFLIRQTFGGVKFEAAKAETRKFGIKIKNNKNKIVCISRIR